MKILIHSNGPHVQSGFGKQARLAGRILKELGHEVAFSCISGLGGQPIRWDGYTLFPMGSVNFGLDTMVEHAYTFGADVVIPIMDLWKLVPIARKIAEAPFLFAPLVISDCEAPNGGPSMEEQKFLGLAGGYPLAVSSFTRDRLAAIGIDAPVIPHCYDPDVYKPFPAEAVAELRKENGTSEKYVIGVCAANNDTMRKGYPETFAAFARFAKRHPEAMLNVFAVYDNPRGHNLPELAADLGIFEKVMFMPSYPQVAGLLADEFTAAWYNSIDVLSQCSWAEGFGVPMVEAMACERPVVGTDCSAISEIVRPSGWLVKGERFWNPIHRAWWVRPNEDNIVKAWEKAYQTGAQRGPLAAASAEAYSLPVVRDTSWVPLLKELEAKL